MRGHVEIFNFFKEQGILNSETKDDFFFATLISGRKELSTAIQELFFPEVPIYLLYEDIRVYEEKVSKNPDIITENFYISAASAGRLDIIRSAFQKNPALGSDAVLAILSASCFRDSREILRWGIEEAKWKPEKDTPDESPLVFSACLGKHELVTWLLENGYEWAPEVATGAATSGCLKIIKVSSPSSPPILPIVLSCPLFPSPCTPVLS
jgi:hypothetical protein